MPALLYAARDPFQWDQNTANASPIFIFSRVSIHYANATTIATFINDKRNGLLSSAGYASADGRTNQLWIYDVSSRIANIQKVIKQLDTPTAQCIIKVRIISIDENQLHSLGIIWGTQHDPVSGLVMDNAAETAAWQITDIPILKLGNGRILDITLAALSEEGTVRVISSPELITNDRETASIESGENIPYQEQSKEGNTSTTFKQAALRLEVTPTLLPNRTILLHLIVNQDKISSLMINGVPAISTRHLTTQVIVHDQETIVLGGIYEQTDQQQERGIPVLRKIPLLGILFRHRSHTRARKQLLIFATPRIIENNK